jgi:ABC-2 type transport system ATP-binding protein
MDEAERCHRVALMDAGRVLALDTVPGLKRVFAEGVVVEVHCPRPAAALAVAKATGGVQDAALFGDVLHVVLRDPAGQSTLEAGLARAGFRPARVEPIPPSLEDVFLHVVGRAAGGGAA